jgi:Reverse transcriptase (RNA-dependent DNA polymerase)
MPFGLTNALAFMQALVNDILKEFLNQFCIIYLNDILIYSETKEQHIRHIK